MSVENRPEVPAKSAFDTVAFVTAYEAGECDYADVIEGFQHLIDTGLAWQLQGAYGRTAMALIEAGECSDPREVQRNASVDFDDNYLGDENA